MIKLFIFLCFLCTINFVQAQQTPQNKQVEYYVNGIDLNGGDTLKFGDNKNIAIKLMQKKMYYKDAYHTINNTIIFNNVILEDYKYDTVLCYFNNDRFYKINFKTIVTEKNINHYDELKFNPDILKLLVRDKAFIMEQIYQDAHVKNIK